MPQIFHVPDAIDPQGGIEVIVEGRVEHIDNRLAAEDSKTERTEMLGELKRVAGNTLVKLEGVYRGFLESKIMMPHSAPRLPNRKFRPGCRHSNHDVFQAVGHEMLNCLHGLVMPPLIAIR